MIHLENYVELLAQLVKEAAYPNVRDRGRDEKLERAFVAEVQTRVRYGVGASDVVVEILHERWIAAGCPVGGDDE